VEVDPDESNSQEIKALTFLELGNKLALDGDAQGAILGYRLSIKLHTYVSRVTIDYIAPDTRYNLGWTLAKIGNHAAAIKSFREAIRLDYSDPQDAYRNIGIACEALGLRIEADKAFSEANAISPSRKS